MPTHEMDLWTHGSMRYGEGDTGEPRVRHFYVSPEGQIVSYGWVGGTKKRDVLFPVVPAPGNPALRRVLFVQDAAWLTW
jgi:hypothetical protein